MANLSKETKSLAAQLAAQQRRSIDEVIRHALEVQAKSAGLQTDRHPRRRMTAEQMMALGAQIAALPVLDPRSPKQIMDDINAL
jgi:antitoxin VapB